MRSTSYPASRSASACRRMRGSSGSEAWTTMATRVELIGLTSFHSSSLCAASRSASTRPRDSAQRLDRRIPIDPAPVRRAERLLRVDPSQRARLASANRTSPSSWRRSSGADGSAAASRSSSSSSPDLLPHPDDVGPVPAEGRRPLLDLAAGGEGGQRAGHVGERRRAAVRRPPVRTI